MTHRAALSGMVMGDSTIGRLHPALRDDIADLLTRRALPARRIRQTRAIWINGPA